jgi:hypothetical protein
MADSDTDETDAEADEEPVGDDASDERRLFGDRRPECEAFVASKLGIARVDVAADRVGGFGLAKRCEATAIAEHGGRVVAGTADGLFVETDGDFEALDPSLPSSFGAPTAVGLDPGGLVATDAAGQVGWLPDGGEEWTVVGAVSEPRRADGSLLATGEGVFRVTETLEQLHTADARDVAATQEAKSASFAATASGIYHQLDGEWEIETDASADVIAAADDRVDAVASGEILQRTGDVWEARPTPDPGLPIDLVLDEALYGITADGTLIVAAQSSATTDGRAGWRSYPVGVRDVVGMVVR